MENKQLNIYIPILGLMLFFVNGDSYATSPLLIQIANDFSINISSAGLTAVAYMIPFGIFTIIFGPLSDKFGKLLIINIAAFGTAIFSVLGGLMQSFFLLCICRALNGIFAAAIMPVSMALIGETAGDNPEKLHASISKTMALMFFGGAVAPVIGGLISFVGSWRLVYIIYGIGEFIIGLLIIFKIKIQSKIEKGFQIKRIYSEAFLNKELICTVLLLSLIGMTVLGSFTYTGKYIEQSTKYSILLVGFILSFFGIGSMVAGRVSVKLKQKLKTKYFIVASMIGVFSFIGLAFFPNIFVLPFTLFGYGFSFMLIQPMMIAKAQNSFPKHRGVVMSMAAFNMCIGGGIGALLYGFILRQWDYNYIYLIGAIFFVLIGIITTRITKKSFEQKNNQVKMS